MTSGASNQKKYIAMKTGKISNSLADKYGAIAKEYTRQFGEVINASFEYWVGPVDGHCGIFGDMSFTMEEIMYVVDNLDALIEKYTSKKAVGEEVRNWFVYVTAHGTPQRLQAINLFSWLRGLSDPGIRNEILKNESNGNNNKDNAEGKG